ncbi:MAG: tannase/feruloyl esterase family alpha/beta hydrolase [Acidobacteriota bacterium]
MKDLLTKRTILLFSFAALAAYPMSAASCESLLMLKLPSATVTVAEAVGAGAFALPVAANGKGKGKGAAANYSDLPGFCRVRVVSKPSSDSNINIEYWLPVGASWNGNFLGTGNSGFSGAISTSDLVDGVRRHYAVASTDTGHEGGSASFALNHPEKLIDFAYRAVHEMTVLGKLVSKGYYESDVRKSYWNGCSAGGRQGLKAVQMYPADFDAVVAGSPGVMWTGRSTQAVWIGQQTHKDAESALPQAKFAVVHAAVLAACDAKDGAKDGIIDDPRKCSFDPATIQCQTAADAPDCLTAPQVATVKRIYSDVKNPRTGEVYFPGHEPGSENGWNTMAGANVFGTGPDLFKYIVFNNADWDYKTLNYDADMTAAMKAGAAMDAMDPKLKPFYDRGGKIIQYHGWADPQISPRSSVMYYTKVAEANGGIAKVQQNHLLYMIPGMAHCGGGDATSTFDMLKAMEAWVATNKAPDHIDASRTRNGQVDRTRPLCAYPATAQYKGSGSVDEAANFSCKQP